MLSTNLTGNFRVSVVEDPLAYKDIVSNLILRQVLE